MGMKAASNARRGTWAIGPLFLLAAASACGQRASTMSAEAVTALPSQLDFGAIQPGALHVRAVQLSNRWAVNVTLGPARVSGPDGAAFDVDEPTPPELEPGQTATLHVQLRSDARRARLSAEVRVEVTAAAKDPWELVVPLAVDLTSAPGAICPGDCALADEPCRQSPGACTSQGCYFTPAPERSACDDGDPSTQGDVCVQGLCSGSVVDAGTGGLNPDGGTADAGSDGGGVPLPTCPVRFGQAVALSALNSPSDDLQPTMSASGLKLCFASNRPGGAGGFDIWCATRESRDLPFGAPVREQQVSGPADDWMPSLSAAGDELFFSSNRPGPMNHNLFRATLNVATGQFSAPMPLAALNSPQHDTGPSLGDEGLSLYFDSRRAEQNLASDLYVARRPAMDAGFAAPTPVTRLNGAGDQAEPSVCANGGAMLFCAQRPGIGVVIWRSARLADAGWAVPNLVNLPNAGGSVCGPELQPDGALLFHRVAGAQADIYMAPPAP